jgi:integrase
MHGPLSPSFSLYTPTGRRKYLTPDERARFIDAARACARPELKTFCLTLAYTGCRISEGLAVTRHSVESAAGFVAIRSLKKRNGATAVREIPVPADLLASLDDVHHLSECDPDRLLWGWCRSQAWLLVKGIMREAGIAPGIHATPKGLRHGFGIHAIRSGVPVNLVQRWLGHARLETTMIYLQALGSEEREIARRMWP